jgi:hypothetical protein
MLLSVVAGVAAVGVGERVSFGQEAMYTNAATMPVAGALMFRPQAFVSQYGADPDGPSTRTTFYTMDLGVQIGLARAWSLNIQAPLEYVDTNAPLAAGGGDHEVAVESVDFTFKHRFFMENNGTIDTMRAAVIFGGRVDTKDGVNVDPHVGVVFTKVHGLHGVNLEADYMMTTGGIEDRLANIQGGDGTADLFRFNASYVYRFWPETFTSTSTGAWYVTAELNTLMETNGDTELRWSPGIMYEGRVVSFEAMLQLPVANWLDQRPELDWSVGMGLRILF